MFMFRRCKLKKIISQAVMFTCTCSISLPIYAGYFSQLSYYTGFSAGYQYVGFKPGFGEGFMPSNSIDYEFFFGGQSNQYFGFRAADALPP
jgi:hypothetical protein